jgi:hypothetical protein
MRLTILAAALLVSGTSLLSAAPAATAAGAAPAEEPGFLFDALRLPRYRMSWEKLVKDVQPTPDWLLHFDKTYDGVAGEMKAVIIEGKPAKLSFVCKPEDCANHKFEVLFEADGRAFGALGGVNESPAFFGGPSPAQQEELTKAIQPSAAQSKSE